MKLIITTFIVGHLSNINQQQHTDFCVESGARNHATDNYTYILVVIKIKRYITNWAITGEKDSSPFLTIQINKSLKIFI